MALSNLQILEAVDEAVLKLVISEIQKRADIDFLVRDFVLRAPSSFDASSDGSSSAGRRLQQSGSGTSATYGNYTLNDPGLSSAWWFSRINVTGAWQLLRLNASAPQTQNSDVVIAVTDSGALVSHPDLLGSWWTNPGETDGDLADNDGNGFIDDVHGACFAGLACSPTSAGANVSRCGIGPNTAAWNGITDRTTHGTKIAGIIGARPNNSIGLAGVAPNLRQMVLKVTDETLDAANPPYAYSDVVRAVDYAYGKGARIFSMSFGNDARYSMATSNKPSLDDAASAYRTLFAKYSDALFVAAAGNEWSSLDGWRAANYTYSPCMVPVPNVLCVGGTNASDAPFYITPLIGTNFGPSTVDMAAPAHALYTTDATFNSSYTNATGTSFSTPMTAAVAGLVLAALGGQTRATSQTPQVIKNILMTSGDLLPGLQGSFRSARRLNAGNAVAAALTLASTNRTPMQRARSFASVNASLAMQAWEYTWWSGPADASSSFNPLEPGWTFIDFYVRNQPTSNFNLWRYGTQTLAQATAMVRIDSPGFYSVQARTASIDASRWQLSLGESVLVWNWSNSTTATADLLFPDAGFYNMTLWLYVEFGTTINFVWQTPGNSSWGSPAMFWTLHEDPPSSRSYDPGVTPRPALWHVVWNETVSFDDFSYSRGYFVINQEPRLYRDQQTMVADFNFATGTDLRNALYGTTGGGPSAGQNVVYGYARANLRPLNYSAGAGVSFRLQGPHARLFINGQNVFDFQSDTQLMIVTPCVSLRNNTSHEIYFYFAAKLNETRPVGLTWAACSGTTVPTGASGAYASLSGSIATNFMWQPSSTTGLPRGFRCDAWPTNQSVISVGATPPFGTPPRLTWMYPRDCPAAYRVGSECRMMTRLSDLFPNLTWNNWQIRCFTYYAGSIRGGVSRAQNLNGPVFQHLAGVRVYEQWGNGVTFANFAPYATRLPANTYQLYVIEWVALGPMWNRLAGQTIWDGTTDVSSTAGVLTTNSTGMILPSSALASLSWQDVTSA